VVADPAAWEPLEAYVKGVIGAFGSGARARLRPLQQPTTCSWLFALARRMLGLARAGVLRAVLPPLSLVRHSFAWRARRSRSSRSPPACGSPARLENALVEVSAY
jgi:hypothetical protein